MTDMEPTGTKKLQRMAALDILRGITVAAMIVVNNNGGGRVAYPQLLHSAWVGLTLSDMVFPTFLFILGISTYLSLSKTGFKWSMSVGVKVVRRTVVILLIGWGIHWFEHAFDGDWLPDRFRLTGVLQRLALCYFAVSVIALSAGKRVIRWMIALLLVSYSILLLAGNGLVNDASSVIARVDRMLLGEEHLYTRQPVDPEGLVSTVSAIAHTLIGFCIGAILKNRSISMEGRLAKLMAVSFALLLCGLAVSGIIPVNKRIWSPSFVLVTCGLASLTLGMLSYVTDVRGMRKPFGIFEVYGVNPLFLYVLSEIMAVIVGETGTKEAVYEWLQTFIPDPYLASAVYAVGFSLMFLAIGYPLYRRHIIIKI